MLKGRAALTLAALAAVIGVAGATASEQAQTAGPSYKLVNKWGKGNGSGTSQFSNPNGIAVNKAGSVYVADSDNDRIQVFSATGAFVRQWGSQGEGNGQFAYPDDVEIAPDATVWVADNQNSRLQAFSAGGDFETSIALPNVEAPRAVAVASDGSVLAAANGEQGSGLRRWVERPGGWEEVGGLMAAGGYRIDEVEGSPDGTVYMVTNDDGGPPRIRRFSVDGKALGSFARADANRGIGIDLDCNIWSSDAPNRRAVKYSPSGKVLATVAAPNMLALDIAVGPKGDVYVMDQVGVVYQYAEDTKKPATAGVPGSIKVTKGKAKVLYKATNIACPAEVAAVATVKGKGVSGKATVKVAAGKTTVIEMKVKAPKGTTAAIFKIVLKTNGRPTTQTKRVQIKA